MDQRPEASPGRSRAARRRRARRVGLTILVYRESFEGPQEPRARLGKLVGPFGLGEARAVLDALRARPERNVLIEGETSAGKELIA